MVLLQGLCYVVDITMVFITFIGIFDFVFHLVELSRGLLLLNLPYRTVPGITVAVVYRIMKAKVDDDYRYVPCINLY